MSRQLQTQDVVTTINVVKETSGVVQATSLVNGLHRLAVMITPEGLSAEEIPLLGGKPDVLASLL